MNSFDLCLHFDPFLSFALFASFELAYNLEANNKNNAVFLIPSTQWTLYHPSQRFADYAAN